MSAVPFLCCSTAGVTSDECRSICVCHVFYMICVVAFDLVMFRVIYTVQFLFKVCAVSPVA